MAGRLEHFTNPGAFLPAAPDDFTFFISGDLAQRNQRIDVKAEGLFRWDPACRRVRGDQQAQFFQVGHNVSDRCRGKAHGVPARYAAAADRLGSGDIVYHYGFKDLSASW